MDIADFSFNNPEWQHFVVEAILRAPGSIAWVQLNWRTPCHTGHPWSLDGADTNTHTLTLTPVYHTSTSVNPAEALRITLFVLSPLFAHTFSSFVSPDTLYRYLCLRYYSLSRLDCLNHSQGKSTKLSSKKLPRTLYFSVLVVSLILVLLRHLIIRKPWLFLNVVYP